MNPALLEEGLSKLGPGMHSSSLGERILPLLSRYIEEIELFNPAYGLVKVRDREELIVKHILDSLAPLGIIRGLLEKSSSQNTKTIADVGSGAGLPGIPLAICMPNVTFTLIERMGRRAGFLRDAVAVLGLTNVRVEEAEMEKLSPSAGNRGESFLFDVIVFRAFKPLDDVILKRLFSLLAPGGIIAAYKGRRQSVEEEISRLESVHREALPWEILPLEVPFLKEERRLLLIRKAL